MARSETEPTESPEPPPVSEPEPAAPPDPPAPPAPEASVPEAVSPRRFVADFEAYLTDRDHIPKFAPVIALILFVSLIVAFVLHNYLDGAHRAFDDPLLAGDGSVDGVSALAWSPDPSGPLFVGTESGLLLRIARDGTVVRDAGAAVSGAAGTNLAALPGEIVSIDVPPGGNGVPAVIRRDRLLAEPLIRSGYDLAGITTEPGLTAVTSDNGGTVIAARAPDAPQIQQQQAPVPSAQTALAYGLSQWRYTPGGAAPVEVGQIFGIDDARAVAALPGLSMVVAGDGAGGVFAIDASQQVSGVNPDSYIRRLGAHNAAITAIAAASGAERFATAAADGTVKVWPVSRASLPPPQSASVQPVDIVTEGRRWVVETTIDDGRWRGLAAINAEGSRIALTLADGTLSVLELFKMPPGAGTGAWRSVAMAVPLQAPVAFGPDGTSLAAFNTAAGAVDWMASPYTSLTRRFTDFPLPLRQIAIDPTGKRLGVLSENGRIAIVDIATGERLRGGGSGSSALASFSFSPDGSMIAIDSTDGATRVYRVPDVSLGLVAMIPPESGNATDTLSRFSASGKELLLYDRVNGRVWRYSLRSRRQVPAAASDASANVPGRLSDDGTRLVAVPSATELGVVDITSGNELARLPWRSGDPWIANRDASRVAVLDPAGILTVYREEADPSKAGPMPMLAEDGLRLSADGTALLLRDPSGALHIADLSRIRDNRATLVPIFPSVRAVEAELLPDGKSVVVAEAGGTIELLSLPDGSGAVRILGHGDLVDALAVSPDGTYLASASLDGRLRVTDLARARRIAGLPLAYLRSGPDRPPMKPVLLQPVTAASNQSELIRAIQQALNDTGYAGMPVDGILGAKTRAAIETWQADHGEKPTGEVSPELLRAITAAGRPSQSKA